VRGLDPGHLLLRRGDPRFQQLPLVVEIHDADIARLRLDEHAEAVAQGPSGRQPFSRSCVLSRSVFLS